MLNSHLKIARRNLIKNKVYAFINISGLALSMACGILIFILVSYHLSFDRFHADAGRIYRFVTESHRDNTTYDASVPPPLGKAFRTDYTFGEQTASIATFTGELITVGSGSELKKFSEPAGVAFTEPSYFDIFNFPLLSGDKKTVLTGPNTVIITKRIAEKYFGNDNPVGKVINLENRIPFTVSGILADLPRNTHQKAEIFLSYADLKTFNSFLAADDSWGGIASELQTFVKLRPGISPATVESVLPSYVTKFRPKSKNVHHYKLQPLSEMHFDARYGGPMGKQTLWVLSLTGLFIVITACVNFINLATAQALKRSKEVGVRKVLGSGRGQLFWQFIAETGFITLLSSVLALGAAWLALPYMNVLFRSQMDAGIFSRPPLYVFLLILAVVVTFLAGAYPGLIIARFSPVAALKGQLSGQHIGGFNTRRALIIFQFTISQLLITGVFVMAWQMHYVKASDLGYNKEAVVMVPMGTENKKLAVAAFETRLTQIPGVEKMAACADAPSSDDNWTTGFQYDNHAENELFNITVKAADDQYLRTFGMELVAGRNLFASDSAREFLVNETFVRKLNLVSPAEVIGKTVSFNSAAKISGPIVGVVKDFHERSFHADINAVVISPLWNNYNSFAIKLNTANAKPVIATIEKSWNEVYPNQLFSYRFLDEKIAAFYRTEQIMLQLIQSFSVLAIFIGCLGLYGLVMFMAAQKTKEIGIRKILGSSTAQILWMFGKEFSRLILVAFLIAAPLAWLGMSKWLEGFKFHIRLNPIYLLATLLLMFAVASLTVGYRAMRAARENPADSLRSE